MQKCGFHVGQGGLPGPWYGFYPYGMVQRRREFPLDATADSGVGYFRGDSCEAWTCMGAGSCVEMWLIENSGGG